MWKYLKTIIFVEIKLNKDYRPGDILDGHFVRNIVSMNMIYKYEITRSQIAYAITICNKETDKIEKENIKYAGLSASKIVPEAIRPKVHKHSPESYADNNLTGNSHFNTNPDLYKEMARALNDGKSVRILYFEFNFPS